MRYKLIIQSWLPQIGIHTFALKDDVIPTLSCSGNDVITKGTLWKQYTGEWVGVFFKVGVCVCVCV